MPTKPKLACPVCRRAACSNSEHREAWRRQRQARPYNHEERLLKEQVVKEWVEAKGYWCPGYGRDGHYSEDLTADHIVPVGNGGDPLGPMTVLCRGCNARRGNELRAKRSYW
jgi:5-methylcytosine-specific restriction enzyme A